MIEMKSNILELIEISKNDLKASKILYSNKLYSQSIYMLQQSSEKAIKAYVALISGVDLDELKRKTLHVSPVAFVTVVEKIWIFVINVLRLIADDFNFGKKFDTKLDEQIRKETIFNNNLKFNYKKIRELYNKSGEDLVFLEGEYIKAILEIIDFVETHIDFFSTFVSMYLTRFLLSFEINTKIELSETICNLFYEHQTSQLRISRLIIIALITYPHVGYSRYPNEILNPSEYNQKLGIIESFPTISKFLEDSINSMMENLIYLYSDTKFKEIVEGIFSAVYNCFEG